MDNSAITNEFINTTCYQQVSYTGITTFDWVKIHLCPYSPAFLDLF